MFFKFCPQRKLDDSSERRANFNHIGGINEKVNMAISPPLKTNNMNKEFIPYEQALELKELGFDEPCLSYYEGESFSYHLATMTSGDNYITPAPLYQQAFRWFRDKKLCDGSVCRHGEADGGYSYRWDIVHEYGVYEERHFKKGYKTYEEAETDCLKGMIEIVKNK